MPIAVIIAGLMLLVAGVRGKAVDLARQVKDDSEAFLVWFALIIFVGLLGISSTFRPVSKAFMALIIIAFLIGSGNKIIAGFQSVKRGLS